MFKMLLHEEVKEIMSLGVDKADEHHCRKFSLMQDGQFNNLTEKIHYKLIPNVDIDREVKGRTKEIFKLMKSFSEGHRLI
jgi:hypothetical protein